MVGEHPAMPDCLCEGAAPEPGQAIGTDAEQARPAPCAAGGAAQPVRAIGEDDDGYDPYTDWHDRRAPEPLFERDPWN